MKGEILVTDSLFIFDEHVKQIEAAGYEVVRLDKPKASEGELIEALQDKVGYVLGGIEYVTDSVIEAAPELKAIVFTGTGFKGHIPGWKVAQQNGIKIGTTPYANVYEVAEWALAVTLAMQRDLFELGPLGTEKFHTIKSLPDLSVGIIGLGHIGKQYADMIAAIGAKKVFYWSRNKKDVNYEYSEKDEIFKQSDIVFVAVGDEAGEDFINSNDLRQMNDNALLVSIAHHGIINENDLSEAVKSGHIRAAIDVIRDHDLFKGVSPRLWYASNSSAAYNSYGYLKRSSDMGTATLLNLLEKGEDENRAA